MALRITGKAFPLNILFGHATYKIDYYQREYAWSRTHVEKLIDDHRPYTTPAPPEASSSRL